jgi:hypothetical protein
MPIRGCACCGGSCPVLGDAAAKSSILLSWHGSTQVRARPPCRPSRLRLAGDSVSGKQAVVPQVGSRIHAAISSR